MSYGTAPRRVAPGVWQTADGRRLTRAGSDWWEHHYQQGNTDGHGHVHQARDVFHPTEHHGSGGIHPLRAAEHALNAVGGAASRALGLPQNDNLGSWGGGGHRSSHGLAPSTSRVASGAARRAATAAQSAADFTVGPDLTAAALGHPHSGLGLGLDAALLPTLFAGPFKGLRGAIEGGRALRAGKGLEAAGEAASAAYHGPGVTAKITKSAIGKLPARTVRLGDAEFQTPRAQSRSGSALQKLADSIRTDPAKQRYAGGQYRVTHQDAMQRGLTFFSRQLQKYADKLPPDQEYALRVLSEGALPETRTAHHLRLMSDAAKSGNQERVFNHQIHAFYSKETAKYLTADSAGRAVLKPDAPKDLKAAWDLFQQAGNQRHDLLSGLAQHSDDQIAQEAVVSHGMGLTPQQIEERLHQPGRVLHGARWKPYDQQIEEALAAHPVRNALHAEADRLNPAQQEDAVRAAYRQYVQDDPVAPDRMTFEEFSARHPELQGQTIPVGVSPAAQATKSLIDAKIRHAVQHSYGNRPEGVHDFLSQLEGIQHGPVQETPPVSGADAGPDIQTLHQGETPPLEQTTKSGLTTRGALEFTPHDTAVMHLFDSADSSTLVHELTHFVASFGTNDREKLVLGRAFGANPIRENGKIVRYEWTRDAHENLARSMEAVIRGGTGGNRPHIRKILASLAPEFRRVYAQADLPDVAPHQAKMLLRLMSFDRPKGGRIVGAEDILLGSQHAPIVRGRPVIANHDQRAFSSYVGSFAPVAAAGSSIRRVQPVDPSLTHAYKGASLLDAFFKLDTVGPKARSTALAAKIAGAHVSRKLMLGMSTELPTSPYDIPIWENLAAPAKDMTAGRRKIQKVWDQLQTGELADGGELSNVDMADAASLMQEFFPEEIAGKAVRDGEGKWVNDIAKDFYEQQTPVDNVRWVSRDFLDKSGLMQVPAAKKEYGKVVKALGIGWNQLNDAQKAIVLWLNPAYIPMQFIGNIGMNLLHQGVLMPANAWRSVLMHRDLEAWERHFLDEQMGTSASTALQGSTVWGKSLQNTIGHFSQIASDLLPRRMALLHEAYKSGYDVKGLKDLVRRYVAGDEKAMHDLNVITAQARQAIVDFDRLHPFEKDVMTRMIWFYPWLRGATQYTQKFILDHPAKAMALAMMADYMVAARSQMMKTPDNPDGQIPYYDQLDIPLSTDMLGLKIPFTDHKVDASSVLGHHTLKDKDGNPIMESGRQLLTFTTPFELAQAGIGFATGKYGEAGAQVVQNLVPGAYAGGVATFGFDPYRHQQVKPGLMTFLDQLSPQDAPLVKRIASLNQSPAERKAANAKSIHPRESWMDVARVGLGSLAPFGYSKEVGAERVMKTRPREERKTLQLEGLGREAKIDIPKQAYEDLHWMIKLDDQIKNGDPYSTKWKALAALYDERNGTHFSKMQLTTEGQYREAYGELLPALYPYYSAWYGAAKKSHQAKADQAPAPITS